MRRLLPPITAVLLVIALAACGDSGGGSSDDEAGCSTTDASLTVDALDKLTFDSDSYEVDAGCIDVTYRNEGNLPHTLLIKDVDGFKLSVGETDEGTVELEPGTYTLYCDIPGHEAAGMEAQLTVR